MKTDFMQKVQEKEYRFRAVSRRQTFAPPCNKGIPMEIDASSIYTGRILRQDSPFNAILDQGKRYVFPKGDILYVNKHFDDIFFYINRGSVSMFHDMPCGKSIQIIKFFEGNTFATSVSVVADKTSFRTLDLHYLFTTETEVWTFPKSFLVDEEMIRRYPQVIAYVLRQQCIKTLIMHSNFTMRNQDSAEKMLCTFILNIFLATGDQTELCPDISQTALADALGIHRTTLNRALRKLREQGILGEFSRNKLEIFDIKKLMELAQR